MKVTFNTNLYNQAKNTSFGAFTKKSEKIIRKDVVSEYCPESSKAVDEFIAKENQRKDRTIKVSSYKRVDHNYVPIGFRTVTVANNLTGEKYKTSVCCDSLDGYQRLQENLDK